tara:strand:- start:2044 stop:2268 length:225 start_codon:yes stop_codon:yes gene_type:complete
MSIESRIKETEDLLALLNSKKGISVQTPIDLEKENLIRKFTSELYQTVDIECREMLKVLDFAEDFINEMKGEKQ